MKYDVTHSCGHTQTHALYGPVKAREDRLRWLATTECTACWMERQRKEPLTAELTYRHYIGSYVVALVAGDTYAVKDAAKAAGFWWGANVTDTDMIFSTHNRHAWQICFRSLAEWEDVLGKLHALGVKRLIVHNDFLSAALGNELQLPVGGELEVELVR